MPPKSKKNTGLDPVPTLLNIPGEWIVMDLGNANARVWCSGLERPLGWRSVQGHIGHKTRYTRLPVDWSIHWRDGQDYVFGERAYAECPDSLDDWPTTDRYVSDWYKRMFAFALCRAYGYRAEPDEPFEPTIVISVPAKEYSNPVRLSSIEESLVDLYKIQTVDERIIEVDVTDHSLNIVPEGLGSFLYTSSRNLTLKMDEGLWAVLDLGYLTGDYIEFLNGIYVPDSPDSSDKLGMQYVAQRVADNIHGQNGPSMPASYIDPMVNDPCIVLSDVPYQVSDEYHEAMSELGKRIVEWMRRKTANKNVRGVLLTGGNIAHQAPFIALQKLPKPILCDDGEFGNLFGAAEMLQE